MCIKVVDITNMNEGTNIYHFRDTISNGSTNLTYLVLPPRSPHSITTAPFLLNLKRTPILPELSQPSSKPGRLIREFASYVNVLRLPIGLLLCDSPSVILRCRLLVVYPPSTAVASWLHVLRLLPTLWKEFPLVADLESYLQPSAEQLQVTAVPSHLNFQSQHHSTPSYWPAVELLQTWHAVLVTTSFDINLLLESSLFCSLRSWRRRRKQSERLITKVVAMDEARTEKVRMRVNFKLFMR